MNTAGLGIIIDASVKYSELNGIIYQTDEQIIALKFALKGAKEDNGFQDLPVKLHKNYEVFHLLCGSEPQVFKTNFLEREGITFFTLYRDEGTLTEAEIDLYIQIMKDEFDHWLIKDDIDIATQDTYRKSLKNNLLKRIHKSRNCNSFWAFRSGGQVFVLNK